MNQPNPSPQYSPDGRWWWDGSQWRPTPARQVNQPPIVPQQSGYPGPQAGGYPNAAGQYPQQQVGVPASGAGAPRSRRTLWIVLGVVAAVLVVPAIVVGILLASGVPLFLNSGERAAVDTLRSALTQAGDAEEMYKDLTGSYTGQLPLLQTIAGLDLVPGVELQVVSADSDGFCLSATKDGEVQYYSSDGGVSSQPCG